MVVKNSELSYRVRNLEEKNTRLEEKRKELVSDQYFNANSTYFRQCNSLSMRPQFIFKSKSRLCPLINSALYLYTAGGAASEVTGGAETSEGAAHQARQQSQLPECQPA